MEFALAFEPEPTPIGDGDRLGVAYRAHQGELERFAASRLRDPDVVADIVQESFLRLAQEDRLGRYPYQPRAWLYRVVLNLIISRARHAAFADRRARQDRFDDVTHETPEHRFLASERRRGLGVALEAVGADGRTGLLMAAQGYSGREIAMALGRSEAATRALLFRARGNVRRELANQETAQGLS